jgi:hypothetical protein
VNSIRGHVNFYTKQVFFGVIVVALQEYEIMLCHILVSLLQKMFQHKMLLETLLAEIKTGFKHTNIMPTLWWKKLQVRDTVSLQTA